MSAESESPAARGGIFNPPSWTPGKGAEGTLAIPYKGVSEIFMTPSPFPRGTPPDVLVGREIRLVFDTTAFVGDFGPAITQNFVNANGQTWARLNCALCPLEQNARFIHDNQQTAGRLSIFTATNHSNLPNPCRGIPQGQHHATFSIHVALDWGQICHFDVELMDVSAHHLRRKLSLRLRHMPGHPVQFV